MDEQKEMLSITQMHSSSILIYEEVHFDSISLFLLALITFEYPVNWEVFAESPSFSRQEINTGSHNGIQENAITHTQTKVDYKGPLDNSSSIQRVTYFSDGKTLNATLWLGGGINKNPSRDGASIVAYGILIDSDNNPATGLYGADYLKEIYWSNKPKTWNLLTTEYSSPINYRNLTIIKNYPGFSDNQKYVLIPISLKDITSPASYKVLYYAIVIYTQSKMLLDYTPWIDIPPTQYSFATSPNPVVVTQGEQQDIRVQLKSSNGIFAKVVSFIPSQNYSAIKVLFNPDKLNASSFGIAPAPLGIEVPGNAQIGQYVIPILVSMSTSSILTSKVIQLANAKVSIPAQGYITTEANLTISVVEPPSFNQRIKDFWNPYGSLVSLVGAGFAAVHQQSYLSI